jgi:tetratricopeptide (TPR) repeat protein
MEFSDGLLALIQGELDDALARFSTALEMGARENQAAAHVFIAYAHLLAGRYAAAAKAGRTAVVEAAGTGAYAHLRALNILARAEWYGGDKAAARARVEQAWAIYRDTHPHVFAGLFALLGDADVASEILRNNEMRWNEGEAGLLASSFWGYFHLGEYDQAYVWLLRAIEDREVGFVAALRRSPALDSIRDDPRFLGAMNRLAEIEREGTPIESVAYP